MAMEAAFRSPLLAKNVGPLAAFGGMEVYREHKNHLCIHAQALKHALVMKETGQSAKQSDLISSCQSEATGSLRQP